LQSPSPERALNAGFDAYLKKPVDPAELATTVQRLSARAIA
jgi:CheY-like chemotaxis protein